MSEIDDKVKELEGLIIWGRIVVSPYADSKLANIHIHLISALFMQDLTVTTAEPLAWLSREISIRRVHNPQAYWVNCITCGHVQLGWDEYNRQMNHADSLWLCPKCGNTVEFDESAYKKVFYPDEMVQEE